jgi:hypothetical protein
MLLMSPLLEEHPREVLALIAATNALALVPIPWFTSAPGAHDQALGDASVTPVYPLLLRSARILLPMSYLILSAMTPILPFQFERLDVRDAAVEPASTATWMVMRVLVMLVMWRVGFWHGRWGTLLLGALATIGGFAMIILAPSLLLMLAGFAMFGAGMGIIYYATLYYAMAVGRAEVDAGGAFEALVGAGYTVGPLASLLGLALGGAERGGPAIVGVVWAILALAAWPAIAPYRRARALRR